MELDELTREDVEVLEVAGTLETSGLDNFESPS